MGTFDQVIAIIMKRSFITLLHIGYWLLYLLLILLMLVCIKLGSSSSHAPNFFSWKFNAFLLAFAVVPALAGFYTFYSFVFSKSLARKRILLFLPLSILVAVCGGVAGAFSVMILYWLRIGAGLFADGMRSALAGLLIMSILAHLNGMVGLVLKGFISWYSDIRVKEELLHKNYETEIALVKSRLDPHFLFNSINNIDVLIRQDPESASLYLNKLSHIMRFMLYEAKCEQVSLNRELEYIGQYVELQKIRNANPHFVKLQVSGNAGQLSVAPMLFMPFIENAFKFAANTSKRLQAIDIRFLLNGHSISFFCGNSISSARRCRMNIRDWELS